MKNLTREPFFHSQIKDGLHSWHPKALTSIYCNSCNEILHCANNECMQPWFECEAGNFCVDCFLYEFDEIL